MSLSDFLQLFDEAWIPQSLSERFLLYQSKVDQTRRIPAQIVSQTDLVGGRSMRLTR